MQTDANISDLLSYNNTKSPRLYCSPRYPWTWLIIGRGVGMSLSNYTIYCSRRENMACFLGVGGGNPIVNYTQ